jgi:glycosyltransferase involved in cell wall biosynthesis
LRKAGFPVVVFTSAHEGKGRVVDEVDGVKVYRLPRLFRLLHTPFHPLWPFWLRLLFAREGVTVINAHTPVPMMADAARIARGRRPLIVTYHNDLVKGSRLGRLLCGLEYRLLTGPTLDAADGVIATSEYYAKHSPRLRRLQKKVTISSPGVELDVFRRTDGTKAIPASFVFVAQLDRTHRHKGLDCLLEAMALAKQQVPEISLKVVGRGNDKQRYAAKATAMGLADSVTFLGFVPDETLRDAYSSACAVVLPAEHDAEGFGMVILEAAACGVPAVASKVGGIPAAVLDGETGLLVPPCNAESLAAALVHLTQNKQLREELANHAYTRVRREFSWEIQGIAMVQLLQAAVSGRNGLTTEASPNNINRPELLEGRD